MELVSDVQAMETLNKYFRSLTQASFAKHGRAYAEILSHWPEIVGEKLAEVSSPERVKWPKAAGADASGGTLIIRSAPGHALDLQHETPHIIERINTFLGFTAVATVKILQGRFEHKPDRPKRPPPLPGQDAAALGRRLSGIADDRLKEALTRLGMGALASRNSPGK
jgi:hypothetical protein